MNAEKLMAELDAWLVHHDETRPNLSLGQMSPMQYRRSVELAA